MKGTKYLLLILSTILLLVNFFRVYILVWGWNKLGRMPKFIDGAKILKPIFIGWQADENLLLAAHFLTPLLILIMISLLLRIVLKKNVGLWLIFPLMVVIFEILFRNTTGYEYVMFD